MFAPAFRDEAKRLLALAWPVTMTHLQWIALNVIDTAMVGHAGTLELAYFSAGRLATWVAMVIGFGALTGVIVFTSRADGAGERHRAGAIFRQGVLFALLLGSAAALPFLLWPREILAFVGVPGDLAAGGGRVLFYMALGYPANFLLVAASFFLEGLSRPRVAMLVTLLTLPLNVLLNYLFVYGEFGAPAMGAAGAALGTTLTYAIGAAILFAYVHRMRDAREIGIGAPGGWSRAWREGAELRRFGFAPGLASGLENAGFAVVMTLSTRLGAAAASAFQAMLALHVVSLALSFGLASAAGVRVGNAVGAGEAHEVARRGWIAAGIAAVSLLAAGAVYLSFAGALVRPFSEDAAVLELARAMVLVMAPFLLFDGVQIVMIFGLRAAGDQVAAGVIQATSFFAVQGAVAWLLIERWDRGPVALAEAVAVAIAVAAVLACARFAWITRRSKGSPGPRPSP